MSRRSRPTCRIVCYLTIKMMNMKCKALVEVKLEGKVGKKSLCADAEIVAHKLVVFPREYNGRASPMIAKGTVVDIEAERDTAYRAAVVGPAAAGSPNNPVPPELVACHHASY